MAVIQLTSPLILASDPTLPLHPVTKRYADAKVNNLAASGFSSGTLSVARLPQFLGDVTMPAGGGTLTLTPTGVAPGTYTKVTVSSSGRVISGSALTANDVPALSWNKIVSGKPTTLAGYGITDALTATGGTITGTLSITTNPVNNYHLANKNYVDGSIVPGGDSIVVGDIVRAANTSTPAGFLRANGGKVSKTTYAALYSVIGDRYEVLLNLDTGTPWRKQAGIKLSGEPIGGLKTTTTQTQYGVELEKVIRTSFVIKNKVYTPVVGSNGGYPVPRLIKRDIAPNGDLINAVGTHDSGNGWTLQHQNLEFFVVKNYLYVSSGSNTTPYDRNMRRAEIFPDGNLGPFSIIYSNEGLMKEARFVVVKNRVYVFDFWFTPGISYTDAPSFPSEYGYFNTDSSGNLTNLVNLGFFHSGVTRYDITDAFVMKEKLVVLAYNTSGEFSSYYASINSDGSIGAWTKGVALASGTGVKSRAFTTTNGAFIFYENNYIYRLDFDATGVPVSWTPIYIPPPPGYVPYDHILNTGWRSWYAPVDIYNQVLPFLVANRLYTGYIGPDITTYIDFSGGLNDYTVYTNGSLSEPDPHNFFLPDFRAKETTTTKYFIKT